MNRRNGVKGQRSKGKTHPWLFLKRPLAYSDSCVALTIGKYATDISHGKFDILEKICTFVLS